MHPFKADHWGSSKLPHHAADRVVIKKEPGASLPVFRWTALPTFWGMTPGAALCWLACPTAFELESGCRVGKTISEFHWQLETAIGLTSIAPVQAL